MGEVRQAEDIDLVPAELQTAVGAWGASGGERPLLAQLARYIDPDGFPSRLPVESWWPCLEAIQRTAESTSRDWSENLAARLERWLHAALLWTRPDGSTVFGPSKVKVADSRRELATRLAEGLSDPTLRSLARHLFPERDGERPHTSWLPPASAVARQGVLAVFRGGWGPQDDLLAVDHRDPDGPCRLELTVAGRPLLGSSWDAPRAAGGLRFVRGSIEPHGQFVEWSFHDGDDQVVRTAVLLPERRLALVAEERYGPSPHPPRVRLDLGPGVVASVGSDQSIVRLNARGRSVARLLPLGLPERVGSLSTEGNALVAIGSAAASRRSWFPLLASWDGARDRRPTTWRPLTVAERSRPCPPDVAYAARVGWGRDDGLVVYRSLARPALRSFLGHQTRARFLIGVFTPSGEVLPLVKIDE